jgi:small subunit ribosomal protein S6
VNRLYETIFILKPDLPEEDADKIITQMEGVITTGGGTLRKTDRMGRRRLAYLVRRYREGNYVLLDSECGPAAIQELERRLKVTEPVLKYQTVRVDEGMKRATKLQQARAKNAARRKRRSSAGSEAQAAAPTG